MNITPPGHSSARKTIFSQSIEYQLTPTLNLRNDFQESNSMLSLSNYLQHDDSSLYLKKDQQSINLKLEIKDNNLKKKKIFSDTQCPQKRWIQQNCLEFHDEQSQSMLLIDSQIKQNQFSYFQNSQLVQKQQNQNQIPKQINHSNNQSYPSRIISNSSQHNKACTQSVELLELLAIPQQSRHNQSNSQNNYSCNQQMQKFKQMYELFQSNKQLFKQINISSNKNLEENHCNQCAKINKQLKSLQYNLQSKQKQIKKYQYLIQNLNSTIFDLKIQNKRLFFQNNRFTKQIQILLAQNNNVKTSQRLKTISYDQQQESFNQIDQNVINSAYTNLSRKTTKNFEYQLNYDKDFMQNEQSRFIYEKKVYPQTPIPTSNYLKYKKQRKQSNHSDKDLQISISQVRQPNLYQIASAKANKILKQQNSNQNVINQNRRKCPHKNDKNTMRFSDLTKQINQKFNISKSPTKINTYKKSPHKDHRFFKIKYKQNQQHIQNLKNHPWNNIYQEDNCSEASQTKTQKLYGLNKQKSDPELTFEQNDYNMLNINKLSIQHHKSLHRLKLPSSQQIVNKNSIIYKSFKEVGSLYEISSNQLKQNQQNQFINLHPQGQKIILDSKNQRQTYRLQKNHQIFESDCLKSTPRSINLKHQEYAKVAQSNSPYKKLIIHQLQAKNFLR